MKEITVGLLNNTEGSAKFVNGDTIVVASVVGPVENVRDSLTCDVEVNWSIDSDTRDSVHGENRRILKQIVESLILVEKYPRTMIKLSITVFRNNGCALSTACNAAVMALVDSGVAMNGINATVECALIDNQLVFNPKLEDESNAKCKVFSSWSSTTNGLVASVVSGTTTQEQYLRVLNFSLPEAKKMLAYLRLTYESKCKKHLSYIG